MAVSGSRAGKASAGKPVQSTKARNSTVTKGGTSNRAQKVESTVRENAVVACAASDADGTSGRGTVSAREKAVRSAKPSAGEERVSASTGTKRAAVKSRLIAAGGKAMSDSSNSSKVRFIAASSTDIKTMMQRLCSLYPDAQCELEFNSTFQLLTAVILSAQTTDTGVNKVTPILFKRFPDARALAEANLEEIKQIIKPTGYYNAKASNIQRCAQALVERFGGVVPQTLEELTSLPGVGRKTANVILGVAFGKPGWTVDTHVQRLVRRLGFTNETDPVKIEFALQKLFPNQDWSKYSITLIWHGRRLCFARKPDCLACPIEQICPSSQI